MNIFTNLIGTISILTCFKLIVILALFVLNLYLYLNYTKTDNVIQSGIGNDKIQNLLSIFLGAISFY
jgi:hypothetical protein